MAERVPCTVRPGPTVAPGCVVFTVRVPGGGSPLRFTRGTVDQRRVNLDAAQQAALRERGFEVEAEAPLAVAADAPAAPKGKTKEPVAAPAEA